MDEHGLLQAEDEVIVCGGTIHGPVLLARSPCNHPGDIQKVTALSRTTLMHRLRQMSGAAGCQDDPESILLSGVLVFSAAGRRPLPDKLARGDLDGDEFYVIFDPDIVSAAKPVAANISAPNTTPPCVRADNIPVRAWFDPVVSRPPDWREQLRVCCDLLKQDDVVSISANAWLRVADMNGVISCPVVVL